MQEDGEHYKTSVTTRSAFFGFTRSLVQCTIVVSTGKRMTHLHFARGVAVQYPHVLVGKQNASNCAREYIKLLRSFRSFDSVFGGHVGCKLVACVSTP